MTINIYICISDYSSYLKSHSLLSYEIKLEAKSEDKYKLKESAHLFSINL